jgi:hypothetical protein
MSHAKVEVYNGTVVEANGWERPLLQSSRAYHPARLGSLARVVIPRSPCMASATMPAPVLGTAGISLVVLSPRDVLSCAPWRWTKLAGLPAAYRTRLRIPLTVYYRSSDVNVQVSAAEKTEVAAGLVHEQLGSPVADVA